MFPLSLTRAKMNVAKWLIDSTDLVLARIMHRDFQLASEV